MLCVGMDPSSIRSGAMSLVFNDWVSEEDQRKICKEYEITMDEDLHDKFKEWKKTEQELKKKFEMPVSLLLYVQNPRSKVIGNILKKN
jgi:glycerate-2-kinase